jgi:hypothetical protein
MESGAEEFRLWESLVEERPELCSQSVFVSEQQFRERVVPMELQQVMSLAP